MPPNGRESLPGSAGSASSQRVKISDNQRCSQPIAKLAKRWQHDTMAPQNHAIKLQLGISFIPSQLSQQNSHSQTHYSNAPQKRVMSTRMRIYAVVIKSRRLYHYNYRYILGQLAPARQLLNEGCPFRRRSFSCINWKRSSSYRQAYLSRRPGKLSQLADVADLFVMPFYLEIYTIHY